MPRMDHWEVSFDERGQPDQGEVGKLLGELPDRDLTDLFVFSHGWNNDRAMARKLYEGLFERVQSVLRKRNALTPAWR